MLQRARQVGLLPYMLCRDDPRPAREQFNSRYRHGGGWQPFKGHTFHPERNTLSYPGDPEIKCVAATHLRDEVIMLFDPGAWIMILQKDGSYEICRMD